MSPVMRTTLLESLRRHFVQRGMTVTALRLGTSGGAPEAAARPMGTSDTNVPIPTYERSENDLGYPAYRRSVGKRRRARRQRACDF